MATQETPGQVLNPGVKNGIVGYVDSGVVGEISIRCRGEIMTWLALAIKFLGTLVLTY